jgi:hypothetical protein
VLPASAYTLLTIESPLPCGHGRMRIYGTEEYSLVLLHAVSVSHHLAARAGMKCTRLVHPRVGKQERGIIIRNDRRRWHIEMVFGLEVVEELLADVGRGPTTLVGHDGSRSKGCRGVNRAAYAQMQAGMRRKDNWKANMSQHRSSIKSSLGGASEGWCGHGPESSRTAGTRGRAPIDARALRPFKNGGRQC